MSVLLQRICLPDPQITDQTALFLRAGPGVTPEGTALVFADGATADFATWANLFDLTRWGRDCALDGLWLQLKGAGAFRLRAERLLPGGAEKRNAHPETGPAPQTQLLTEQTLGANDRLDLTPWISGGGLLAIKLQALGPARLEAGAFRTNSTAPAPRLAIAITTFRREAEVAATATRVTRFLDEDPDGQALGQAGTHLFVVDNGNSATLPPHPRLTHIPNRNLGGAGGFARGLMAATDGGFSHCLFMDDDASFQMENLIRTHAFLRLARDPKAAVAGAMISAGRPWAVWENGAIFDRFCRPCDHGTDLRERDQVARMLFRAAGQPARGFYGGWWYFAFPVAQARFWPFPFFVRGDDISFSLANDFAIHTLNGVVSFQEDFATKESPQTLYLDLRNHLHHHLTQEGMQIGSQATAAIALRFIGRSLARMHYDSATAQLLAWEDVMRGPGHFTQNADMAERRARVAALTQTERWRPDAGLSPARGTSREKPPGRLASTLGKLSLNGHLVPFWRRLGRDVEVDISERGLLWPVWGARSATYRDPTATRFYAVRHDKWRFMRLSARTARLWALWLWRAPRLGREYRAAYPQIASRPFWEGQFTQSGPSRDA